MKERVKFYGKNDMCYGMNLDKIESIIIPKFEEISINDAIEYYEIDCYFKDGARKKTWSDTEYDEYKRKSEQLLILTKRFFNGINDENIVDVYNKIELGYHSAFWFLFQNCKLYNKISNEAFETLISQERISPRDLFRHKDIVKKFDFTLRQYILENDFCLPILLHVCEQDYTDKEKLFLPTQLSGEDICNYFDAYIDSEHVNPNYLEIIVRIKAEKRFPISDEIRLKAKRRYKKELEEISKTSASICHEIQISFSSKQDEVKIGSNTKNQFVISYSTKWLQETLDYPSILNNFIYVFEFVDFPQMRSLHVNQVSQSGVFERIFNSNSSRNYPKNHAFNFKQGVAMMQMSAYYDFLLNQKIQLEDVLKWFFTEYIQLEFKCPEMRVLMPTSSLYVEKCSTIITAFESILKQYHLYVKNGEVDFELVGMSTTPILFENIKSLVPDKYIYGVGADYERISFWLFSDQCTFKFIERIYKEGRQYDSLIDLLLKEEVYLSDYRTEERSAFENMADLDLVSIGEDEKISLKDFSKLAILRELFEKDVISRWHFPHSAEKAILEFMDKGIIETRSTLFSQPEIDYFNYLLNRSEYCNGLEIRNRYIHGIQQVSTNEEEHRQNYFTLLRLFVLFAIKINDDLCLKEMYSGRKEKSQF